MQHTRCQMKIFSYICEFQVCRSVPQTWAVLGPHWHWFVTLCEMTGMLLWNPRRPRIQRQKKIGDGVAVLLRPRCYWQLADTEKRKVQLNFAISNINISNTMDKWFQSLHYIFFCILSSISRTLQYEFYLGPTEFQDNEVWLYISLRDGFINLTSN